jgi:hypothetical protein
MTRDEKEGGNGWLFPLSESLSPCAEPKSGFVFGSPLLLFDPAAILASKTLIVSTQAAAVPPRNARSIRILKMENTDTPPIVNRCRHDFLMDEAELVEVFVLVAAGTAGVGLELVAGVSSGRSAGCRAGSVVSSAGAL